MRQILTSLLLSSFALPAQTITLVEGTPGALQVTSVAESAPNGAATTVLQNIDFAPIEMTGRTLAHELDPTRARRLERNGIQRIELPNGGRLFHYRRDGGLFWGFLHVAPDGAARVVLEHAGVGASLVDDPYVDRLAIADDGLHCAISRLSGALHVVRLDGGTYAGSGRADWVVGNGVSAVPMSMMIGPSCVWFQAEGSQGNLMRLWRCDLAEGSARVEISPPFVANGDFRDQMTMSRDGAHIVFLYGPLNQERLYIAHTAGAAAVLPPVGGKYEEPGYLPEAPGEPAMLLNDDGTRLFYVLANVRDELFLLDTTGQMPPLAMTEDAIFQPYIGVHILPKFTGGSLLVAIGDPAQMDWFRASLASGGGAVVNVTGTGSVVQPFPAGQLDPRTAAAAGNQLLVLEVQAGVTNLRRLDAATGATTALQSDVLGAPQSGGALVGAADLVVSTSAGDSLLSGVDGTLLATLPGLLLTPPVRGPLFTGTFLHLPIQWGIPLFYAPFGIVDLPPEPSLDQISMTAAGGVVLVGQQLRYVALGANVTLNRPSAAFRRVLSGAGG